MSLVIIRRVLLLGLVLLGQIAAISPAWAASELQQQALAILQQRCHTCHGADGADEGGFDAVLDVKHLVERRLVVAGQPQSSPLLKRIVSGQMPVGDDPLPAAEVKVLTDWITAGPEVPIAAAAQLPHAGEILAAIETDLVSRRAKDRPFLRYFLLPEGPSYEAGGGRDLLKAAVSKLINSLSWGPRCVVPVDVAGTAHVVRIDLRDYDWKPERWRTLAAADPLRVEYRVSAAERIAKLCEESQFLVRADWFVTHASRPPLYHELLEIPETDRELEKRLNVNIKANLKNDRVARSGFSTSGVSQHNRMIERHDTAFGAYWKSYDFSGSSGRKNLFAHPLGPEGDRPFEHDGGEIIFNLPNGLQGYMLVDNSGKRIDQGPTSIVSDPKRPDRAVINGLSCMSCHWQGIIPKTDQIRPSVLGNLDAFKLKEIDTILAQYPSGNQWEKLVDEDNHRFAKAAAAAGVNVESREPVSRMAALFEAPVSLDQAAREYMLAADELLRGLQRRDELARVFAPWKVPGGRVQRELLLSQTQAIVDVTAIAQGAARNSLGMTLVELPAGEIQVSTADGFRSAKIAGGLQIGIHEVTLGQYRQFVRESGYAAQGGYRFDEQQRKFIFSREHSWQEVGFSRGDQHPVVNVSLADAQAFCRWLSEKEGARYRLPSEAEWQWAAQGGQDDFPSLDTGIPAQNANLADAALRQVLQAEWGEIWTDRFAFTAPVGSFLPGALGLFDIQGNVSEWCQPADADDKAATRGGSWATTFRHATAASRHAFPVGERNLMVGFRVVREK